MWLSSSAYTKIEFEVPVNGSYDVWNPIWRIVVNGLDLNNTRPAGNITGYIVTNLNRPQPPTVTSVEYSVDDGATWKLAQINSVSPYNFSFFLGNVPEYSYVSLRINLTNPKMSYTVLKAFYTTTPPDTTPPTISVAHSPTTPTTSQTVTFTVTAQDNPGGSGIAYVKLYIDNNLVQTWNANGTFTYIGGPYPAGTHNYYASATDKAGNTASTGVKSFVVITTPAPPLPNVTFYLFVTSSGGDVWYREFNGTNWGSWRPLGGVTFDGPSAAYFNGKLYVAVRGGDNRSIWYGYIDVASGSFSGWVPVPGLTPSKPTLVSTPSGVLMLVRGLGNDTWMYPLTWPNASWIKIPGATIDAPVAVAVGNKVHMVVRGLDGYSLWHGVIDISTWTSSKWNASTLTFSGWASISGQTDSTPYLCADKASGVVYLAVKAPSGAVYINMYTESLGWHGWISVPGGLTDQGPAIQGGNRLIVVVKGLGDVSIWVNFKNSDGTWAGWTSIDGLTPFQPELISNN
jgi:hypothetical protein